MNNQHAALLLCVMTLSGCGLKGDLYIPEPVEAEPTSQDADADEATGADEED